MASGPFTSWKIDGETMETVRDLLSWASKSLWTVTAAMKLKYTCSLEEKLWPILTAYLKVETLLCNKGPSSRSYGFSSSHVYGLE